MTRHNRAMLLASLGMMGACTSAVRKPPASPFPLTQMPPGLIDARPEDAGFAPSLRSTVDSIIIAALDSGEAPGAAVAIGRHGRLVYSRAYGKTAHSAEGTPVTLNTMYDMASLTKVVATTTLGMMLEDQGKLDLDKPVAFYVPELSNPDKADVTVRMILTHSGGFEADVPRVRVYRDRQEVFDSINRRPLRYPPGKGMIYSDVDLVLMQMVIEHITGSPLDSLAHDWIFAPLGMQNTMFRPDTLQRANIAATERDSTRGLIWGVVHDPTAWVMGGVAGHAGLFSSAHDAAIFTQMLLNGGEYNGIRLIKPSTIARWSANQGPGSSRAIGWDTPSGRSSAGRFFSPRSFGHTGFTGTSIWADPQKDLFIVLLTNRVNESSDNNLQIPLRRAVADAVQRAVVDAPLIDWEAKRE